MKELLACQLQQLGLSSEVPPTPEQWTQLLATIQRTYVDATDDRYRRNAAYDAVIESAIDGVLVTDANGLLVRCSRRFLELWSFGDEFDGGGSLETRLMVVAQRTADPAAFIEQTHAICSDDELESTDEISLLDGRTIERLPSPIHYEGHVIGRVWFFRDVTVRKRHEAELHRLSDERHQFLFKTSPLPIWIFDPMSLAITAVTDAMVRLLGFSREQLVAMTVSDLKPADDHAEVRAGVSHSPQGAVFRVGVKKYRRHDGTFVDLDITSHTIEMDGKRVMLAMGVDVTEARRLSERLHQAQKLDAIGQLAGGVAHDFNNILAAILSNAECAREDLCNTDEAAGMLREIELAAERGATLTRQLLAFSRQQPRSVETVDLNGAVRNIDRLLRRLISEDIVISVKLAPKLGAIHADPTHVDQIAMNLILNARDAMPHGGTLVVETSNQHLDIDAARGLGLKPGPYVVLAVSDTRVGMSEATRAHIFEPFFTTKEVGKGTGLGLATVFGIVQQSEGTVTVYSELGHGSTFTVYLPRIDAARTHATTRAPSEPPPGRGRILLVEDDALLRTSLERRLRNWGYGVVVARDPGEALDVALHDNEPIELMITDLVMPQMDGRTLASRILPARPATKVLFMSGYTQHAAVKLMAVSEREHFLAKPFTGDQLARALEHALTA